MLIVSHTGRSAAKGVSRDDDHFALFRTFVTFSFTPGSSPFVNSTPTSRRAPDKTAASAP